MIPANARFCPAFRLFAALAALIGQPPRAAAEPQAVAAAPRRTIQEVIVTAQKTEQNIRDVPISMTVIDDEFIAEQGITDYRDLALHAPNAHVDPGNGLFPDINVRGFGSALSNKAFEQSVGLNIDGVPYGRTGYFQGPLYDLDRVEILRGPQGTLFGRNTTAGLLNVAAKRPTDELSGAVGLELGDLERRRFEGAVGGPILPRLVNFRISGLSDERDGLIENTTARVRASANDRMNKRDRKALRAQLGLPDILGSALVVSYERIDFEFTGIGWEPYIIPEQTVPFYRTYDPGFDLEPDNWVGSVDTDEYNQNEIQTIGANASVPIGAWRLEAVAGHSVLKVRSLIDDDFGPAPMIFNTSFDDNPQTTGELRFVSPSLAGFFGLERVFGLRLGTTELTAGVFYQRRKLENSELGINFNVPVLAQFAAANMSPPGTPLQPLMDFIGPAVQLGGVGLVPSFGVEETTMFFEQTTKSIAGFAQMDWHPLERWTLQYGMRFTDETKDASWNRVTTEGTGLLFPLLGGGDFATSRSRSEFAFTPKAALRYDWTDEINFYVSWGKGFKAGGFNEQAFNAIDDALEFAAEKATAWELGARARLLDGTAMVNLALFRQDVTDFQVLTLPPLSVATTVVNAGEARAQGVELDGVWLPADWLTIVATVGFNDSEFLDFVLGQCSFDRSDTDGNGDGRCDVTGEPLFRTPKWTATLVPSLRWPLAGVLTLPTLPLLSLAGLDFVAGGRFEYQDVQYLERTFDERVRQAPFVRFGGNLGFANEAQGWSIRVNVENLTEEATDVLIRDVPLGGGNFYKILEPQRLIFGSFRWSF